MNAERLHIVARAIKSDIHQTGSPQLLQQLRDALQNLAGQPQQNRAQQQVAGLRKDLLGKLQDAPSNEFSPIWMQVVTELHFDGLLGKSLAARIEEVFNKNQITPAVAHQEIAALFDELSRKNDAVVALTGALEHFGIAAERLPSGICELGILVPREHVKSHLDAFGSELEELNRIFGVFQELATGQREALSIRSISSSDLTVFLDVVPKVAVLVALTLERIVHLYKELLEIRRLRDELEKSKVPPEHLKGIEEYAGKFMDEGIENAVTEVLTGYLARGEKGRMQELNVEMRSSVKKLASRIDRGFNISIRAGDPPDSGSPEKKAEIAKELAVVKEKEGAMSFLKITGSPILSLPAGDDGKKPRK